MPRRAPPPQADETLDVAALEAEIQRHNELYWVHARPEISDTEFDTLVRRLKAARPDSPVLDHLGAPPNLFAAVKHQEPMLSLDKSYERQELLDWAATIQGDVVVMPKVDGLACSLVYGPDGALKVAATRGSGVEGEDITPNARAVREIPKQLRSAEAEVRGEVFMKLSVFERFKKEGKANPRNLAAGALRQKDPNQTGKHDLSFLAYDLRRTGLASLREKFEHLKTLGFSVIPHAVVPPAGVVEAVEDFSRRRAELDYEIDGVVLVADRVSEQARLGETAHHPRWAMAWKFQGDVGESTLLDIEWSVARTGTVTPIARVEPVALSGVTVSRASLHNAGFVEKLALTRGARLEMVRRGGVIPHVERVISQGREAFSLPAVCPSCGAALRRDGDFLLCGAPGTCPAARAERIVYFAAAVDMQGVGPALVEAAMARGLLNTPADLYRLTAEGLMTLERQGEKNATKVVAEIATKRVLPVETFLVALGIEGLGKTVASTLATHFGSLEKVRAATTDEMAAIFGIGPITAQAIADGLKELGPLIDDLLSLVKVREIEAASGPLLGKVFCFTGALKMERKRAEARVRAVGATTASSVTRSLTHLVVGGGEGPKSTKQKAADKLMAQGVPLEVLSEEQFEALMAPLEG